jgi:succinylglutamate desuccinylase
MSEPNPRATLVCKDPHIPSVIRMTAHAQGPHVVLFGGVHGDEVSGVHAVEKLLFDFFAGTRMLQRGSLTLARGNEHAIAAERRYIKHNLNRLFRDEYGPDVDRISYEFGRAQELKTVLQNCDYFLDLHSAPIAPEPFLVAEQRAAGFFENLGIRRIVTGWSKFCSGTTGGDAENYANAHGATSATLESGSHFEKRSNDVSYNAAISLLAQLEMIAPTERGPAEPVEMFDMYAVVTKDFADFKYAGEVENFQFFTTGDAFAFQGGRPLTAREDTYLLIPMNPQETRIGEEVCYLGRKVDASA